MSNIPVLQMLKNLLFMGAVFDKEGLANPVELNLPAGKTKCINKNW